MGRKAKFSYEFKIDVVTRCLSGRTTISKEAKRLGIKYQRIYLWISQYQSQGSNGLRITSKNTIYSDEFKLKVVLEYLHGNESQLEICNKYGIRSATQLRQWVLKYNGHEKTKSSGTGGDMTMTKSRKTTFDERVEIVEFCITHDRNFAETARNFEISYQQARNYTIKYEEFGLEGLKDNRGHRKALDEMNEIEKLRAEVKLLRASKESVEMELSFLKKLEEIERRRG